jgi:hypothetical protein
MLVGRSIGRPDYTSARAVRITPESGPSRRNSVIYMVGRKSSLRAIVRFLKEEILHIIIIIIIIIN